jgi:hypothetical protein
MKRVLAGGDEIRFPLERRREAEICASTLPGIRDRARELLGFTGTQPVRLVLTDGMPRLRDLLQPYARSLAFWFTLPLALLLFGLVGGATAIATVGAGGTAWLLHAYGRFLLAVRRAWPHAIGLTIPASGAAGPVILVNLAPSPPPEAAARLRLELSGDDRLRTVVAHEFAHVALRSRYRSTRIPAWLDEGVAYWFDEESTGIKSWTTESRVCVREPDSERDARRKMLGNEESRLVYYRLTARYYWEVRHLANQGRITELLATPVKQTAKLRPSVEEMERCC